MLKFRALHGINNDSKRERGNSQNSSLKRESRPLFLRGDYVSIQTSIFLIECALAGASFIYKRHRRFLPQH